MRHEGIMFPDAIKNRGAMFPHAATAIPAFKSFPASFIPLRSTPWLLWEVVKYLSFRRYSQLTAVSYQFQIFLGSEKPSANSVIRFFMTLSGLLWCAGFCTVYLALETCSPVVHVNCQCHARKERIMSEESTPLRYDFLPSSATFH